MNTVLEKHRQAMALADEAFAARHNGDADAASRLFRDAFRCEQAAAEQSDEESLTEPTRSVLYRSAATLALDCGEFREAERLAARGLGGDPPDDVAEELREVLEQVYRFWPARQTRVAV
jgi:hypothetical protein